GHQAVAVRCRASQPVRHLPGLDLRVGHSQGDRLGLCAGLLGKVGDDRAVELVGRVEPLDLHGDLRASVLEAVENRPDVAHAAAAQPVELPHLEFGHLAGRQGIERLGEHVPRVRRVEGRAGLVPDLPYFLAFRPRLRPEVLLLALQGGVAPLELAQPHENVALISHDTDRSTSWLFWHIFKGLTDKTLAWQTERFLGLETHREGITVFIRPEIVAEIALDGVQTSTRYPGGVALRFARLKTYRSDK